MAHTLNGRRTIAASGQPPGTMWMQGDVATIFQKQRRIRRRDATQPTKSNSEQNETENSGHLRPQPAVYERRPDSQAAVPFGLGQRYYYAGLYGGETSEFLALSKAVARRTEADLARGIIAKVCQ